MSSQHISIGSIVPSFTAKTRDGEFHFDSLRGKNVVVYFYPKDSTPGCTIESKAFRDHYKAFQALNTEIIGVSRDNIKSHCKFIDNHELNFPLISDEDESVCKLFDVLKQKSLFGKKYSGIVRSTFLIDKNGVLVHEWRDVSVMNHVKTVLKFVTEMEGSSDI